MISGFWEFSLDGIKKRLEVGTTNFYLGMGWFTLLISVQTEWFRGFWACPSKWLCLCGIEGTFPGQLVLCTHILNINKYTWLQLAPADSPTALSCESARKPPVSHRLRGPGMERGRPSGPWTLSVLLNSLNKFFSITVDIQYYFMLISGVQPSG